MSGKFLPSVLEKRIKDLEKASTFTPDIFAQQKAFIEDPSKFKSLLASRRAGKSTTAGVYLYLEAVKHVDSRVHYIGLTRKSAKNIIWKELKTLNKNYKLGLKFNNTDLIAELSNGSEIFLTGGNDEAAIETIRGMKSRLVIVDEAQSYRAHLRYLLDEVLTPMLADYDGTLCQMGTPSAGCAGPFFEATTGADSSYSTHKWTILDNPFIPHAANWLKEYKRKKGWSDDNPVYLREWCGRWVKSLDSIVYKYTKEKNLIDNLPKGKFRYIMGVDIGYDDATAYVVGAIRDNDPTFYVVDTYKKSGMVVDDIMAKTVEFISKYNPDKIVMDSGGGGKLVSESLRKRYGIPIKPAQKKDKRDFIEMMNSDFHSGRIKVLPGNEKLTEEWDLIQWDEDRKREDERFICDLADACLYTWRESTHYVETVPPPEPQRGTDDWYARQVKQMEEQAEAQYRQMIEDERESNKMFGDFGDSDDWE